MRLPLVLRMVMLLIYGLFNHGANSSDYIVLNDDTIMDDELEGMWKVTVTV